MVASPRNRKRRRRALGVAGSVLFHALVFVLGFSSLRGMAVTGGGGTLDGEVNAIPISLAGIRGPGQSQDVQSAEAMNALFLKIRAAQTGIAAQDEQKAQPKSDLDKLFDVVHDQAAEKGGGQSDIDEGGKGAKANASAADMKEKRGPANTPDRAGAGSAASSGSLWGQIKPCWDQLPPVSTVPVTLEITLDAGGRIATPPKILRSGGAPDERRLISEARALAAITACVPYQSKSLTGDRRDFKVEFAAR